MSDLYNLEEGVKPMIPFQYYTNNGKLKQFTFDAFVEFTAAIVKAFESEKSFTPAFEHFGRIFDVDTLQLYSDDDRVVSCRLVDLNKTVFFEEIWPVFQQVKLETSLDFTNVEDEAKKFYFADLNYGV